MAFSLPDSIDTSQGYIPALTEAATVKLPRVPQQFASAAELAAAVVTQRANNDLGLPGRSCIPWLLTASRSFLCPDPLKGA